MNKIWENLYEKLGSNFFLAMFVILLCVIGWEETEKTKEREKYTARLEFVEAEVKGCKQSFIDYFIEKEKQLQQVAVQADEAIIAAQSFSTKLKKVKHQNYLLTQQNISK